MECGVLENATPEQELLTRLVALNHERAAEEANGLVRWLGVAFEGPGTGLFPCDFRRACLLPWKSS